ncbi:site-specific integrase [Amnibacterium kyonggiense]|uniref:Site-specific recombinase XerD n=1 Tax=Amnibacterium kyonggiense TaxID=595671 RepID=A0A4R7FFF5_9MICO|nr:site-specific integrase [Amnibacterium kyonggiense]TDS76113.1 site-specific recombinase XerD [Amnibacterium kyonggiense]
MGSVESYANGQGKRYRVLYRRPDHGQTQKRGFRTKKEAELFLASVELDKQRGAYIDPSKARVALGEWMDVWLTSRTDMRATTRTRVEGIIRNRIVPALGSTQLWSLNRLQVQQWASELPGAPDSVRKTVNVLSSALRLAVEDGRIVANPAQRLKLPKAVKSGKRYLTHDQVAALATEVGQRSNGSALGYDVVILTLAYCGLRWGELAGLRAMDVDLARARLEIRQTIVADKGYPRIEPPKDYEHRSVAIPAFLVRGLDSVLQGRTDDQPAFRGARTAVHLRNHVFRNGWFNPAAAIGLEGLTPHELRHTAASLAVSAGANVKAVQRMLGHASAAVTLDVYADLFDDDLASVATVLDQRAMQTNVANLLPRRP